MWIFFIYFYIYFHIFMPPFPLAEFNFSAICLWGGGGSSKMSFLSTIHHRGGYKVIQSFTISSFFILYKFHHGQLLIYFHVSFHFSFGLFIWTSPFVLMPYWFPLLSLLRLDRKQHLGLRLEAHHVSGHVIESDGMWGASFTSRILPPPISSLECK